MVAKTLRAIGVAVLWAALAGVAVSADPLLSEDIEASITGLWGDGSTAIWLFGVEATVGQVVRASLMFGDSTGTSPFRDPLPEHTFCGDGCRNAQVSAIARLGIGSGYGRDLLLVIDLAGRSGFMPGSSGYIRILNPGWRVAGVVAGDASMNYSYSGYGVRIAQDRLIEWEGRGGCSACSCPENGPNFVVLLQRLD